MIEIKCQYTRLVPIEGVKPHSKNANRHPKDQIKRLAKLIEHQGIRHPLVISNRSGQLVVGHGRLEALKLLKVKEVPVDFQEFKDDAEEYQFLIADNSIAEWAELDLAQINEDFANLGPFDLDLLGIQDFNLDFKLNEETEKKEKEIKLYKCPHCNEAFELGQAEKI